MGASKLKAGRQKGRLLFCGLFEFQNQLVIGSVNAGDPGLTFQGVEELEHFGFTKLKGLLFGTARKNGIQQPEGDGQ